MSYHGSMSPSSEISSSPQLSSRPGYVLVRAALKVRQFYATALAEAGLLPNHHAILSVLNELGPCHQKELAARVGLDQGDIVGYLDSLQENGDIIRERDSADRRRQIVTITPGGRKKLVKADKSLDRAEEAVFGGLSVRDREFLDKISVRIYDAADAGSAAR
jgi:DNA-binding MarR family transcriptional regulator